MRAVIICGGEITNYQYVKSLVKEGDTIICADRGYDYAKIMGLKVDVVVGDFDSIDQKPNHVKCVSYPAKKDFTDSELALKYAREIGCREFLLLAATGSRMDHSLANIMLLTDCLNRGEYAEIVNENNKIMITDSELHLNEAKGSIVSLIPLSDCVGVTTYNLAYPLREAAMLVGKSVGVSNAMLESNALISLQEGIMLVIIARD